MRADVFAGRRKEGVRGGAAQRRPADLARDEARKYEGRRDEKERRRAMSRIIPVWRGEAAGSSTN